MKKILSILPIVLCFVLASCAAAPMQKSYWYKFGYISLEEDGLLESYTYSVEAKDSIYDSLPTKPPFHLVGSGTYTVKAYREEGQFFKITTDFYFKGKYKYPAAGTYSEEFEDSFSGESRMKVGDTFFEPISMHKEYVTTIPDDGGIKRASYVVDVNYTKNGDVFTARSSVADRDIEGIEADKVKKIANSLNADVTMELKGRVIDSQEQLFFVLRLQNIKEGFSDSIVTYNPLDVLSQTVSVSTDSEKVLKKLGETEYPCFQLKASLRAQDLSSSTSLFFTESYPVKYIHADENGEREMPPLNASLLLEIKQGDLIYTLTEYINFAKKVSE